MQSRKAGDTPVGCHVGPEVTDVFRVAGAAAWTVSDNPGNSLDFGPTLGYFGPRETCKGKVAAISGDPGTKYPLKVQPHRMLAGTWWSCRLQAQPLLVELVLPESPAVPKGACWSEWGCKARGKARGTSWGKVSFPCARKPPVFSNVEATGVH